MKYVTKRFHCPSCKQSFERFVLETAVTAACPKCQPFVAFLESIGMTPKQALVVALCVVGISYWAGKS